MSESAIVLTPEQTLIVRDILRRLLSSSAQVWVFGSRAGGLVKRSSDLDLAIDAGRALSDVEMADLPQGFEDSDLPFEVDVLDWQQADEHFQTIIGEGRVRLER